MSQMHSAKSVRIRVFLVPIFRIRTKYGKIRSISVLSPNADQKNDEHFSRRDGFLVEKCYFKGNYEKKAKNRRICCCTLKARKIYQKNLYVSVLLTGIYQHSHI